MSMVISICLRWVYLVVVDRDLIAGGGGGIGI